MARNHGNQRSTGRAAIEGELLGFAIAVRRFVERPLDDSLLAEAMVL